ncbi:HAMP domain-containing sensor histidine kinase [Draconibacterium sp. IB214405]|uniref:sensor histidine kinase n=1 Tax=Draconibacterium sp. IB214405 TaxID=3097352 RepID=UPI002A154113|nr:HAMP domain-containing sensor histidine kinase [Draconibacterium sp. IB214405]MDX8338232.1 HAMP domain-containing sensor histidine kinase [Draconibacterium sp. IB214405]
MNRKLFTGLIILMGISILGIIAVQLVWMNNAIRVKNEMFERGVNQAMQQTVSRLEDLHNLGVVNEMVFAGDSAELVHDFTFDFDSDSDDAVIWNVRPAQARAWRQRIDSAPRPVKIIREFTPENDEARIEIHIDNDSDSRNVQSYTYNVSTSTNAKNHMVIAGDSPEPGSVVFVKSDTIIRSADSLYTISTVKIDSLLTDLDTFEILAPDVSKRVKLKATSLKRMANKVVTEVAAWDVRQLDENLIYDVLKKELNVNNIPLDFEYGIFRGESLSFPKPVTDSLEVANTIFQVELYPNDIFQKDIKLAVVFPERDSFIYRSLNWLLIASFLFSVIILMTFALSIFYIIRQKKISEMKSDFINNMTHEFKTPIATISVATDSITNPKVLGDEERIKYFAGMIKKENTRMNRQVEDILTIARLDKKDFEFHWETIDVHDLISDAVQGIKLQVEKRGGKIELDLKAINSMVTTDRIHCTNVVYNLIDNANKYSGDAPEITVWTVNQQKGVVVSVSDKGIGMNKAVQAKIFERFYRQTSGNIHNVKGFGLGLSYVKAVLEANRGTISVSSEPGKGSKFDVFLPFVRE